MRHLSILISISVALAACQSSKHTDSTPTGESDFETPLGSSPSGGGSFGRNGGEAADAAGSPSASPGGGSQPTRMIEESDIYKVVGNTLFVMNHYRGLQIIDISDRDHPVMLGRAPIYGYPQDMYVRGTNAYVIVSDYYNYWWAEDAVGVAAFHGSQVRVIDISDVRRPHELGSVNVAGDVTDSRIVGDVLYLVAQRYAWWDNYASSDTQTKTVVVSVDVSDPMNVHQVDAEEFPQDGYGQHIMVTPDTAYVATTRWNYDTSSYWYTTSIQYVDISDPAGHLQVRGSATVPGQVSDRWSMDEYEGVLRVASGQSWGNGDVFLNLYSVADPDHLNRVGGYTLHVNERLTAARFDGTHGYLVSARNYDPLFSFDLTDPAHPALLGALEMSGWLDFLVPQGDRIVALGHDQVTDPSTGHTTTGLAVSLIDPTQATPELMTRVPVGQNWGWVPSSADDYAKVFKVLPEAGLIMLPFQSWSSTDYRYIGGVQLIDYSPSGLRLRGLIQNAGWVERGIPHGQAQVLTLSDQVLQIVDITDRDHPETHGRLELSRNVQDFAPLNDQWAAQLTGDWYMGDTSLAITPLLDPDSPSPTAEIHVPAPYGRMFTNGSLAYLSSVQSDGNGASTTRIQTVDLSDPAHPQVRGSVALPELVYPGYHSWYWGYGDEVAQRGSVLAFHRFSYSWWVSDCYDCGRGAGNPSGPSHAVYIADLSDPDYPVVASTVTLDTAAWAWGMRAEGSMLYLSEYRTVQRDGQYFAKYYLRRIDISDPYHPVVLPEINIPGQLIGMSGDMVYTVENPWDSGRSGYRTWLNVLRLANNRAYRQGRVELPGWVNNVIVDDGTAFATSYWYEQVAGENGASTWTNHNQLFTVDLTQPSAPRLLTATDLPVSYAWLQKIENGRAFLGAGWGVLSYDVTNPAAPRFQKFYRTQGWSNDLIVRGERLFVPSGAYGVQIIDLVQ